MKKYLNRRIFALIISFCMFFQVLLQTGVSEVSAAGSTKITGGIQETVSEDVIVYSVNAVADMGADNTGERDSTAAIQKALDSVKDSGGIVYLPAGRYKVTGTLNISGGVTLRGEWKNPDGGGLGKGTILMAYSGAGNANGTEFIRMASGSCLRDLSVWYPEQKAESPTPYPYTIKGSSHTSIYNITLYNSYNGFKNNSCSSMLIRGMYGTFLNCGIWGAYAYDVPRIEKVSMDTSYWAESGLEGAPSGNALDLLNNYCENNLTGILAGEQDWGYWFDIRINHAKYACYLTAVMNDAGNRVFPGNDAVSYLKTQNTKYGIYIHSTSYPGLEVSYSDINADIAGIYYGAKPADNEYIGNESGSVKASYSNDASVVITKTTFSGSGYAYLGMNDNGQHSAANFNNCIFNSWTDAAIYLTEGNLVCSNGEFNQSKTAIRLGDNVLQAVLTGNSFKTKDSLSYNKEKTYVDITEEKLVPDTPDYEYSFAPSYNPSTDKIFNVKDFGATAGDADSTRAFQDALDSAKAQGGGTVFVPAGYYTLKGSLAVPEGVELRGSFDGAHYGNSTTKGTVLYVYANKDNADAKAFITLAQNAGVRGFTIVYPEQGITNDSSVDEVVHKYPATVELNKGSWVRTCSINGAYTMLDAMKNICDGFVINDVTGCCLGYGLLLGHGTNGGYVQDYHSNYTSWPTSYKHIYKGNAKVTDYTTQNTTWMVLGDFSNVKFFSDFTILISTGMQLIKDPYTGKCTQDMLTWGTAFDATGDGIIGESGADSKITLLNSMGVYNQHETGYNIVTREGFTGTVSLFNADVWSPSSRVVNVAGGTVNLTQYLSWCCYQGICHEGGTVNMYGSTFVGSDTGSNLAVTYEKGAAGTVAGNNNNNGKFNAVVKPDATDVTVKNNGLWIDRSDDTVVEFNTYAPGIYNASNGTITTGWKALTPIKKPDGKTQNHAILTGYNTEDLYMKLVFEINKGSIQEADSEIFKSGTVMLRQAWSAGDGSDDVVCYRLNDGNFYVASGKEITLFMPMKDAIEKNTSFNWSGVKFINITLGTNGKSGISMKLKDARITDRSVTDYWKYHLYRAITDGPDINSLDKDIYAAYIELINSAMKLYNDESASMEEIKSMTEAVEKAAAELDYGSLDRTLWKAYASDNNAQAGNALDADMETRWTTLKSQEAGQWFMVDLGQPEFFDTVEMLLGTSTNDTLQAYEIYVSLDKENWGEPVKSGNGQGEIYYTGIQYAQYIKVVQTSAKSNYWSIHEFNLKNTLSKTQYSIAYIDDNKVTEIRSCKYGTAPDRFADPAVKTRAIFAGWYDKAVELNGKDEVKQAAYSAADLSGISSDRALYAGWINIENGSFELLGTQIRISEPCGLRFITQIGTDLIEEIESLNTKNIPLKPDSDNDKGIGFGTVAALTVQTEGKELVKNVNAVKVNKGMVVCPAVNYFEKTDEYYKYTCVVKGISVSNYETEIAARPYITYKDANDTERTFYYTEKDSSAGGGYSVSLYKAAKAFYDTDSLGETVREWLLNNIIKIVEQ